MGFDYDVGLSFAGEDRAYVEEVSDILHSVGLKVFYDRYVEAELWGKDLYTHLDDVYQNKCRYCVMFISQHYAQKLWTNHERQSAQARAFQEKGEYILPVRLDDTAIPGIHSTTGHVDARSRSPEELARLVLKKINPDLDIDELIDYLRGNLPGYEVYLNGTHIVFNCDSEGYYNEFPTRVLLEMYRVDALEDMLLWGLLPY